MCACMSSLVLLTLGLVLHFAGPRAVYVWLSVCFCCLHVAVFWSSAYAISCVCLREVCKSEVFILKTVGKRTLPLRMSDFNWAWFCISEGCVGLQWTTAHKKLN